MPRPPLDLGHHGNITVRELSPGRFVARCRYREMTGKTVKVEARGPSKTAARRALQHKLSDRRGVTDEDLKPHHRVRRAAELWLLKVDARVADGALTRTSADRYRHRLEKIVLPEIGDLRLVECTVARLDNFFTGLGTRYAGGTRKGVRTVVSAIMGLAVRHGALPSNPVRDVEDIRGGARQRPRALTPEERRRWLDWLDGESDDPKERRAQQAARRRDLPDLVRFMLGTGVRIGEALAVRWCDVDLEGVPVDDLDGIRLVPIVAISGNVVAVKGEGLQVHRGKTERSLRVIPLPRFVVETLAARDRGADTDPVFPVVARGGGVGYKHPNNTGRYIREARRWVGLDWMSSHAWRKTAATIWHDAGVLSTRQIGDLTGHAKLSTLTDVYIARGELHPEGAAVMDAAWMDT
ncbi:tyrosine-type recombinase/integrase [Pseudonocardia hispaniensis]|uniref:Tyrosine-type recombinase/integrase n=1 Tax=Pseudonocardia hispaniensis TaxID=904933 RepID=A0ABW1IX46_9PSEU